MANLVEFFQPVDQTENRKAAFASHYAALQKEIRKAVRRQPKSQDQVAEEMTDLLGCTVTTRMLYSWTASSRSAKFPLAYLDVFCKVVGDDTLKRLILGPELREMLELGERAAAILDDRVRRRLLKVPGDATPVGEKRNGSCVR
jgi:hypothetical protein